MGEETDERITTDEYGRRKWDVEAYAREASASKKQPEVTYQLDTDNVTHRQEMLAQSVAAVKKYNVINPLDATSKRFGFCCPVCNLTFQDNLKLVDHFNSPQHHAKVGTTGGDASLGEIEPGTHHASLGQVMAVLEKLIASLVNARDPHYLSRLEASRAMLRSKKRERRKRKRLEMPEHEDPEFEKVLGFSSFGSKRKK